MSFSASIVAALFFGFVLIYIAWSAYGFFQRPAATEVVRMGSMEAQGHVTGMIVRNEEVVYANRDGRVVTFIGDFDRVRENELVVSIQDSDAVQRNETSQATTEADIIEWHNRRHEFQADPGIERINTNIRSVMDRSISQLSGTNVQDSYALLDRLETVTGSRNQLKLTESVGIRPELERDLEILNLQADLNSENIYAPRSGIMSPYIDVFSGEITPANMQDLLREQIEFDVDHTDVVPRREVLSGDPVFKIVENTWYVIAFMPNEMARDFEAGQDRTFFLESALTGEYEPILMRVIANDLYRTDSRVILRSNRNVMNFLNQRNVNIRTTDNVELGLKIPVSAITTVQFVRIPLSHLHGLEDDYYILYHGENREHIRVDVEVYDISAGNAYVPLLDFTLGFGEILIPAPGSEATAIILNENSVTGMHGVFVSDLGFADFRQIFIDGDLPSVDGHVLLDPSRNPNLRQWNMIVTDASNMWQGRVIE